MTNDGFELGSVFKYPYRWRHQIGLASEAKDRTACLLLKFNVNASETRVAIVAISDRSSPDAHACIEVPQSEIELAGLSHHRQAFVHLDEMNVDDWLRSYTFNPNARVMGKFSRPFISRLSRQLAENIRAKRVARIDRRDER
jgi:hypothetical protein